MARRTTTVSSTPTPGAALASRREPAGGPELFLTDAGAALAVANEARYRTLERVFGIQRSDVNLLTAVVALMVANSVYEKVTTVRPPRPPSIPAVAIGVGALRESIYGVAGPASRDTPLGGTLIALAVLGGLARPPVVRSIRGTRSSWRRVHHSFLSRYGHLIPGESGARPSPSA
jgi:hypothetical protein